MLIFGHKIRLLRPKTGSFLGLTVLISISY
jgi:hypothetical protein